jgi:hypothetical protein
VRILLAVSLVVLATLSAMAQVPPPPAVPMARFVGTWVGTQRWTIANPPPGSRQDQPVTLVLEEADGKLRGTLTPFLGGEDGATIVEAAIVGSELRATAIAGNGRGRGGWKAPVRIAFTFTNEGLLLKGSAEVKMGDVPWMSFGYDLERKRSRY